MVDNVTEACMRDWSVTGMDLNCFCAPATVSKPSMPIKQKKSYHSYLLNNYSNGDIVILIDNKNILEQLSLLLMK